VPNAIEQNGLQPVEIVAGNIAVFVHHGAGR